MDAELREQLERQIAAISRDCPAPLMRVEAAPIGDHIPLADRVAYAPAPLPERPAGMEAFGTWLLAQHDRGDWVDNLAAAARADRGFPKNGDPDDVRRRLQQLGVDGDAFEQVDDAERDWLCY